MPEALERRARPGGLSLGAAVLDPAGRLSAWDVAGAAGTIPNEILSRLGPRLPRIPV